MRLEERVWDLGLPAGGSGAHGGSRNSQWVLTVLQGCCPSKGGRLSGANYREDIVRDFFF